MTQESIGVAVIGAGMVGRAHAAGYRVASQLYDLDLPEIRLVAIADAHEPFAVDGARRFGYDRAETSWQAIVDAPDIDVVSVAIANVLHRPVVEALLAAGKHVLCEKPLAPTVEDAKAMVTAAEAADAQSGVGFSFRRTPAINAIREQLESGAI
jgi:predicted dehydrogenase